MYVSDILYNNIPVVSLDGIVRRLSVAGIYLALRFSGDGGVCSHAELYKPSSIFIGEENLLYDSKNYNVRAEKQRVACIEWTHSRAREKSGQKSSIIR